MENGRNTNAIKDDMSRQEIYYVLKRETTWRQIMEKKIQLINRDQELT